jgi:hypothetical protein
MELGLLVNLVLVGLYTALLIALSVDEAGQGKRASEDFLEEKLKKAA